MEIKYYTSYIYDFVCGQVTQDGYTYALVRPLINQSLLHLHPDHMMDLPAYLPQAPASVYSSLDQNAPLCL